ncbi:hypothetical protein ABEG17_09165 [Pedococcus sp. KACC 23699]|uniref:Lipoprotein n=1 Tax=Pedococcus sp. KACC 23699 TaxID=3149228 RepID=A0AAU7JZ51_9MICO
MSPRLRHAPWARGVAGGTVAIAALVALSGCGGDEMEKAMASTSPSDGTTAPLVCAKDATAVDVPASFPAQATPPSGYVVTGTEARSGGRVILTAVSPKPFKQTLADMQGAYSTRGWTPSEGEVEARDAESNFAGNELRGRWAIRQIPDCPDNTSVSVLVGK